MTGKIISVVFLCFGIFKIIEDPSYWFFWIWSGIAFLSIFSGTGGSVGGYYSSDYGSNDSGSDGGE